VSSSPTAATFDLLALRFHFTACDEIHFPADSAANLFRGQFGKIMKRRSPEAYSRFFAPSSPANAGPSGLHDPPRPFVLRANHLDGVDVRPGGRFHVGVNLFDTGASASGLFERILVEVVGEGLGPGRGRAMLERVEGREPRSIALTPDPHPVPRVRVRFLTPTELKGARHPDSGKGPEFGMLIARIRDRASTLHALYGPGPLEIDFKAIGERANRISMTRCEVEQVDRKRLSRGTGQWHPLGGFVGVAEYQDDDGPNRSNLAEFIPFLEIARWTGVGRQTVWGKGEIAFEKF
jgi:hypothetical protein